MRYVGAIGVVDGSSNSNEQEVHVSGTVVVWWQQVTPKADVLDARDGQNIRLPETAILALEPGYLPPSRSWCSGKKSDHVPPFPHTHLWRHK